MTTSRLPFILYDGRACGGGAGSCFAVRLVRIGYGLVALVDLEGGVGFADDPIFEGLASFSAVSRLVRRSRRRP